jgi:hypothetical protein
VLTVSDNQGVGAQILDIKVVNCGGLRDLMSEMESSFLVSALALFRNREDLGRGYPRANVNLIRAYHARDFYAAAAAGGDILHVIGHANGDELEIGVARKRVKAAEIGAETTKAGGTLAPIVVSTGCKLQSAAWRAGLKAAGAEILIATGNNVTPAALTAFDMAFYSALLAQVRKGKTLAERVIASFDLADKHYRAIHAAGTPFAKFTLERL